MSLDEEQPDGEMQNNILDVRKAIEKSTSKVSLRDLEKKGFRKVKVLRAGDINQLIFKAVQTVLAKQTGGAMGEAEREQILSEAKAEYEKNVKQLQAAQQALDRVESEKATVDQKAQEVEEAKKRLEAKVGELNGQLVAERKKMEAEKAAFAEEKKQLDREKQNLFEKGMDAVKGSQAQVAQLQEQLRIAQQGGGAKVEELEKKLRTASHEGELSTQKYKSAKLAQDDLQARCTSLQTRIGELEHELDRVKAEPKSDPAEIASMKAELEKAKAASSQSIEMLGAIMTTIKESKNQGGGGGDFEKHMKQLQLNLSDQIRKFAGSASKGGWDEGSTIDLGALLAAQADAVPLETNIKDVGIKQQSAAGVKDKLSKLKNLRGGGGPPAPAPAP